MDTALHQINNSENRKTEDEILSTVNEALQILISDVEDLLKKIQYRADFSSGDPDLNYADAQINCENLLKESKTSFISGSSDLSIIEGLINCEIKRKGSQKSTEYKAGFNIQLSDLNAIRQIIYRSQDDHFKSNECKINLNLEQLDLNFSEIQINCETTKEDFPRSTECKSNLNSGESNSNFIQGQMICEISREDLLKISENMIDLICKTPDLSDMGQISCMFNLEHMRIVTKCNTGLDSEKPILNVKRGQISCEIDLEDLLKVTEGKEILKSEQTDLIVIEGQINYDISEDLLGFAECKIDLRIDQPGLNVKGHINYEINMKDLLKVVECKTGFSSEEL